MGRKQKEGALLRATEEIKLFDSQESFRRKGRRDLSGSSSVPAS